MSYTLVTGSFILCTTNCKNTVIHGNDVLSTTSADFQLQNCYQQKFSPIDLKFREVELHF
uniref:Uncharacterized protein n=1 Tax=Medicago truncatula TaxID=3880 RepID=I3SYV9_MEDTR|nr:unknown [Medicago truncatula]